MLFLPMYIETCITELIYCRRLRVAIFVPTRAQPDEKLKELSQLPLHEFLMWRISKKFVDANQKQTNGKVHVTV